MNAETRTRQRATLRMGLTKSDSEHSTNYLADFFSKTQEPQ
jgi:hypothetical protein